MFRFHWMRRVLLMLAVLMPRAARAVEPLVWESRSFPAAVGVMDIASTADGYLWFAGDAGIHRFDGARWVALDGQGGLPQGPARRLLATRDGAVWMATAGGILEVPRRGEDVYYVGFRGENPGLFRWDNGHAEEMDVRRLPSPWVWAMAEDRAGAVWLGTDGGIARVRRAAGGGWLVDQPIDARSLPSPHVSALVFDGDGALWVGSSRGVARVPDASADDRRGRVQAMDVAEPVMAMDTDGAHRVWVATSKGLAAFQDARRVSVPPSPGPGALDSVRAVMAVPGGNDVLIAAEYGLIRWHDQRLTDESIPGSKQSLQALAFDREGSLWLGLRTAGALQAFRPLVRTFGAAEGLGGRVAFAVLRARDGSIWTTTTGGISHLVEGRIDVFRYGKEIPGWDARGLAEAPDGTIVSEGGREFYVLRGDHFEDQGDRFGTRDHFRSIHFDAQGDLWITWEHGGLTVLAGGLRPDATRIDIGNSPMGRDLCPGQLVFAGETSPGTVWFGTDRGALVQATRERVRCLGQGQGAPSSDISAVTRAPDGTLWVAMIGEQGLARLWLDETRADAPARFVSLPRGCGLPRTGFFSLVDDGTGHAWMSSGRGVVRVPWVGLSGCADGQRPQAGAIVLDELDGLRSSVCLAEFPPEAAMTPGGAFWVPTSEGLSVIEGVDRPTVALPAPVVEAMTVDGVPVAHGAGPLEIGPSLRALELRWTAPSFLFPKRVRFTQRLEGLESAWSAPDESRAARYGRLSPGRYTFRVRAELAGHGPDPSGFAPSPETTLSFVVLPTLGERWSVRALGIVALLALALLVHRTRTRQIRARHAAVEAERTRLAREIHDGLGQAFLGVRYHLDGLDHLMEGSQRHADARGVVAIDAASRGRERELLLGARRIVDRAQGDLRRTIWDLRAAAAERTTLREAIQALATRAGAELDARVHLDWQGAPVPPSGQLEHEVPRIVEEAITNAVRHGGARAVTVRVLHGDEGLRVSIEDDGKGIGAAGNAHGGGGFGMMGMHERAVRVGGALTIADRPGGGVDVTLDIPRAELEQQEQTT